MTTPNHPAPAPIPSPMEALQKEHDAAIQALKRENENLQTEYQRLTKIHSAALTDFQQFKQQLTGKNRNAAFS